MSAAAEKIREAGVIGCGGAGFPTHAKLKEPVEHIIVNAMECEPLLRTDRFVVERFAPQLVAAARALMEAVGAVQCTFALKETYLKEIAALEGALAGQPGDIRIHTCSSYYPAGDEHLVVYEVTGRTVSPQNIPLAVGCVVMNASTLLGVGDALEGMPFTRRYVTVAGEVERPCVLRAPVGTPFLDCLRAAGGYKEDCCIVSGGPMMGAMHPMERAGELYVEKTTSGILVLPEDKYAARGRADFAVMARQARAACIQCSYCTQLCPRYLLGHPLEPHLIMRKLAYERLEDCLDDPVIRSAALCCECGVCEIYACPMLLKPRQVNARIKAMLAEAGVRYPRGEESTTPHPMREARKAPTQRVAARAGVLPYYGGEVEFLAEVKPRRVSIALRQGIGAAAAPLVGAGDRVAEGQRIAACPEGKLGAHVHASIAGRVVEVGDAVVIRGEEGT